MTLNDTAAHFLQTYADGNEVEGGWLFGKALQQTRLDFSPESLGRLDHLLAQVRERAKPSGEALASDKGRNFQSLLVFYMMEFARRRTGADIVWHDRACALRALPPGARLPETPFARLLAMASDQGVLLLPLAWLGDQLASAGKVVGSGDYLAGVVAQLERDGPPVWWQAVEAMGRIASWQMMMAADGGAVVPMMLGDRLPTTWVMLMSGANLPGEDVDEALKRGGRKLDENPERHGWQVLSYDGWLDEGSTKIDAVMVLAKTYGAKPLYIKLAFPYRPARAGRRFAILQPTLRESNLPDETIGKLNGALERGIQGIKWSFGTTWNELREQEGGSPQPRGSSAPAPAWAAPAPSRARRAEATPPAPPKKGWKPW